MDRNEAIEIPFGAFDSELKGWEYTIPEGYEARIEGNKIILEPKESEDEKIRKEIIGFLNAINKDTLEGRNFIADRYGDAIPDDMIPTWLAWLEKQGESKPIGKLQLSEELYEHIRNTCACIDDALSSETLADINDYLSMAERSARSAFDMIEKQGSQNLANSAKTCNDEQKFKVGDWLIRNDIVGVAYYITQIHESYYLTNEHSFINFREEDKYRLWTIQDAKDGDVLADGNLPFIFKKIDANKHSYAYCGISVDDGFKIESDGESGEWTWMQDIKPATKEQRDLLFQKMGEAGYEWDAEKKELRKIEQKSAWSEEDEKRYTQICVFLQNTNLKGVDEVKASLFAWLKELKERIKGE